MNKSKLHCEPSLKDKNFVGLVSALYWCHVFAPLADPLP